MEHPFKRLIQSLLVMVVVLGVFLLLMNQVEMQYYQDEVNTDRQYKTDGVRTALNTYATESEEIGHWFNRDLNAYIRLKAMELAEQTEDGEYTGKRLFEDGMVVRIRDGEAEFPDGAGKRLLSLRTEDITREYHQTLFPYDVPTEQKNLIITSGKIIDGWYYVDWTLTNEYVSYINAQLNLDSLLETLGEAYEGELLLLDDDALEGTFLKKTKGLEGYTTLKDLGLTAEDLTRESVDLVLRKNEAYVGFPVHLSTLRCTVVYLDPVADKSAKVISRNYTLMLFVSCLMLTLITGCISVQRTVLRKKLTEAQKKAYHPKRIRKMITRFGALSTVFVMLVAFFSMMLQYMHNENISGNQILSILDRQEQAADVQTANAKEQELEWYIYYGQIVARMLSDNPAHMEKAWLANAASVINADFLMVFNEKGEQILCSNNYVDFVLGESETDSLYDFRRLLHGVDYVIHEPQADPSLRKDVQLIGVCMTLPEKPEKFGALLIAVDPAIIGQSRLGNLKKQLYSDLLTSENMILEIDPDTRVIMSASRSDLVGLSAADLDIREETLQDQYMDFFRSDGAWYYGITRFLNDTIYIFAANGTHILKSALVYALISGVLFLIGYTIMALFAIRPYTKENFTRHATLEKPVSHEPALEADAPEEKKAHGMKLLKKLPHLLPMWEGLTPGQKTLRILEIGLGIMVLTLLLRASGTTILSQNAVLSFIFTGEWARKISIFSITAIMIIICLGALIFLGLRILFNILISVANSQGETICRLVHSLLNLLLIAAIIYESLSFLGVDTATLLASMGLLSLAISLGAKDLVADILAGVIIVVERTFQVGEIVEINGFRGRVKEIGVRSTKLIGESDHIKIINNADVKNVMNLSRLNSWYHITLNIPVSQDVDHLEEVFARELPKIGKSIPEVISGPLYKGISHLGNGMMTISIMTEYRERNFYKMQRKLNKAIKQLLDSENIPWS